LNRIGPIIVDNAGRERNKVGAVSRVEILAVEGPRIGQRLFCAAAGAAVSAAKAINAKPEEVKVHIAGLRKMGRLGPNY